MKPVKNFSEKINKERHTKLYVKDISEPFTIHVDNAGWLWIEPDRARRDIKNCIRIEFKWEFDAIRIHIIPIGMGLQHKKEMLLEINPNDFITYDTFQIWICKIIRSYYQQLKN